MAEGVAFVTGPELCSKAAEIQLIVPVLRCGGNADML